MTKEQVQVCIGMMPRITREGVLWLARQRMPNGIANDSIRRLTDGLNGASDDQRVLMEAIDTVATVMSEQHNATMNALDLHFQFIATKLTELNNLLATHPAARLAQTDDATIENSSVFLMEEYQRRVRGETKQEPLAGTVATAWGAGGLVIQGGGVGGAAAAGAVVIYSGAFSNGIIIGGGGVGGVGGSGGNVI